MSYNPASFLSSFEKQQPLCCCQPHEALFQKDRMPETSVETVQVQSGLFWARSSRLLPRYVPVQGSFPLASQKNDSFFQQAECITLTAIAGYFYFPCLRMDHRDGRFFPFVSLVKMA